MISTSVSDVGTLLIDCDELVTLDTESGKYSCQEYVTSDSWIVAIREIDSMIVEMEYSVEPPYTGYYYVNLWENTNDGAVMQTAPPLLCCDSLDVPRERKVKNIIVKFLDRIEPYYD